MQLDADEDGQPFYRPPLIAPAPLLTAPAPTDEPQLQQGGESGQEAAAVATADLED